MTTATLTANRRLASILGWTNIVDAGDALLGSPPWGIPSARGQAAIPDWAGDWNACMALAMKYRIGFEPMETGVAACGVVEFYADHPCEAATARFAVVKAVTLRLEMAA